MKSQTRDSPLLTSKNNFTPFYDHRGHQTIGKPLYNFNQFYQLKNERILKMKSLSFMKNTQTDTSQKTVLKKVNPLQSIMNKLETAKPETDKRTQTDTSQKTVTGLNADNLQLSIEKFSRVEDILKRLEGIHSVTGKQSEAINL